MLSVFICEDNEEFLSRIKKYIDNFIKSENLNAAIACATTNPDKLLEYIRDSEVFGLYFVDLDLQCEINGFRLAEKIRRYDPRAFIVIVTSDSQSKQLSFEYVIEAMDYITKDAHDLEKRICNCVLTAYQRYSERIGRKADKLSLKLAEDAAAKDARLFSKGSTILLDYSDIIYIEVTPGKAHHVTVHCTSNKYVARHELNKIHPLLDMRFVRCHRAYIVNVEKIFNFNSEKRKLWLNNGEELDMGGTYVEQVRQGLNAMYARI
ncbi:MAG: response regulator transcription factor [Oscillospiraceae bacterium]|nr:response regulator transcription factor [Oscillospiraceae bacterium]